MPPFHLGARPTLLAALLAACAATYPAQAHQHIAAGEASGAAADELAFVSGNLSGTIYHLLPIAGKYGGQLAIDENARAQFPNDSFTFTALSDGQTEDAQPGHADTGADIWLEITSVVGPAGARFGFWEAGSQTQASPTASFLTNTPTGGYKLELSEPLYFIDPEEQDPYGHIHGRAWSVTQPGDYYVGFTLYDLSHVGPGGGPLYQPSQTYTFHFVGVGVPEPRTASLLLAGVSLVMQRRRRSTGVRRPSSKTI